MLTSITCVRSITSPACRVLDVVWSSTHAGWGRWERAGNLCLCQWRLLGHEFFALVIRLHILQSITHLGTMGSGGQLCGSAAAVSYFLFLCFHVISTLISNMQERKACNEHPRTIHLVSTIINNWAIFCLITEPFHSKFKKAWHFTHKYCNMHFQRAEIFLQLITVPILYLTIIAVILNIT